MKRFEGRTAFITGGGHGIGRACVGRLAVEGAEVVVADIDEDAARAVAAELPGLGARGVAVRCDVTSSRSVAEAVSSAVANFGGVDVLVNRVTERLEPPHVDRE